MGIMKGFSIFLIFATNILIDRLLYIIKKGSSSLRLSHPSWSLTASTLFYITRSLEW